MHGTSVIATSLVATRPWVHFCAVLEHAFLGASKTNFLRFLNFWCGPKHTSVEAALATVHIGVTRFQIVLLPDTPKTNMFGARRTQNPNVWFKPTQKTDAPAQRRPQWTTRAQKPNV